MSIIRAIKDSRNPYVQINKKVFDDPNLSLKAKGFIGYCLSKPDHWLFHVAQLKTVLKEKEFSIYNIIKECIDHGYAIRWQSRNSDGSFNPWQTIISDSKEEILKVREELNSDSRIKKSFTLRGFPDAENPDARNPTLVSNDSSKNEISKNPPPPTPPEKPPAPKPPPAKKTSLRSEEEERQSFEWLRQNTTLQASDCGRMSKEHSFAENQMAVRRSFGIEPKKGLINLLKDIIKFPDKYPDPDEVDKTKLTPELQIALSYNEKMRKLNPEVAKHNEEAMKDNYIIVRLTYNDVITQTSLRLNSEDFMSDMRNANKTIDKALKSKGLSP